MSTFHLFYRQSLRGVMRIIHVAREIIRAPCLSHNSKKKDTTNAPPDAVKLY